MVISKSNRNLATSYVREATIWVVMKNMKNNWWKILCVMLLFYSFTAGFLSPVPRLAILNETIRNLYFHVPMWFAMTFMLLVSFVYSIVYLATEKLEKDHVAAELAYVGILFGILGIITGMFWANYTWGNFWPKREFKLQAAAIGMLMYLAYAVLRGAFNDEQLKARVSAVFNILAFPSFVALIYILPRLADNSLHPGNGGNPGFNAYDRDRQMNLIFYSANIGFILLGLWIATLKIRLRKVEQILEDQD